MKLKMRMMMMRRRRRKMLEDACRCKKEIWKILQ
jgi:hypothetical protein